MELSRLQEACTLEEEQIAKKEAELAELKEFNDIDLDEVIIAKNFLIGVLIRISFKI